MPIIDDKSPHCIPFLLALLDAHQARSHSAGKKDPPPFFIGLNGVQGAGKTVLVSTLQKTLRSPPYSLPLVTLSLDDLYLSRADQISLAESNPDNPLLQHRGQPSTHDLTLGRELFASLHEGKETAIPQYDKSAFDGKGDRVDRGKWEVVNEDGKKDKVRVVIFEGWCVGFRAWDDHTLRAKWESAVKARENDPEYKGRLGYVRFEHVKAVNDALRGYDVLTDQLDALIHIDAQDLHFVYDWRQQQERSLRAAKGTGMTEDQVDHFVDGYYPSYELFTETLRDGVFKPKHSDQSTGLSDWQGRQLRLVVDKDRRVQDVVKI